MRYINQDIVRLLSDKTKCPILEMSYSTDDNHWYVCFEEYTFFQGKNQIVHIDELLEELRNFDNIDFLTHEVYEDNGDYYEQISFLWKENR